MSEDKTKTNLADEELEAATGGVIEFEGRTIYYATCSGCGHVWRITMGPNSCPQCGSDKKTVGIDSKGKKNFRPNHGEGSGIV